LKSLRSAGSFEVYQFFSLSISLKKLRIVSNGCIFVSILKYAAVSEFALSIIEDWFFCSTSCRKASAAELAFSRISSENCTKIPSSPTKFIFGKLFVIFLSALCNSFLAISHRKKQRRRKCEIELFSITNIAYSYLQ